MMSCFFKPPFRFWKYFLKCTIPNLIEVTDAWRPIAGKCTCNPTEPKQCSIDHHFCFSRYYDAGTPGSSLSPASSSCLQSPCSFTLDSPSPPPTTADFCEFLQASGTVFEKDFSNLTLSGNLARNDHFQNFLFHRKPTHMYLFNFKLALNPFQFGN